MPTNIVRSSGVAKHAGDLARVRADEEAPGLARVGVGAQHLVVAEAGVGARVDRAADTSVWIHSRPLGAT